MTTAELQEVTLTEATRANKKITAGPFLNALAGIAYKAIKTDGEFVLKRPLEG